MFEGPRLTLAALAIVTTLAASPCGAETGGKITPTRWKYTLDAPADGWEQPDFDDSEWSEGFGGFGTRSTPGARVSTEWTTNDIWLRKSIQLESVPADPALYVAHDEDAEVFINGEKVLAVTGYIGEYRVFKLAEEESKALKAGRNALAVHCHQTSGGQFIDVHVIDANTIPKLPRAKRPTTPFQSELITKWGEALTAENAWTEYPRPMMAREQWQNLNGNWNYAITDIERAETPENWDGKILVPFGLESKLSGVQRLLDESEAVWYHRKFSADTKAGERLLLHFEAVDYSSKVLVNGQLVGENVGGNNPFSFDITDALQAGENDLVVRVEDATEGSQLRGKQVLEARGIWYTQVSGIWQTVWLEPVSARHIEDTTVRTELNEDHSKATVRMDVDLAGEHVRGEQLRVTILDGEKVVFVGTQNSDDFVAADIESPKLWSPSSPHLYQMKVAIVDAQGSVIDEIDSYVGIRTVGKTTDENGNLRFTLNGETIFHLGPLDQGWWPDGLLTPPSDEAMLFDIEYLKEAGFNMIRKHIKVEPRRFYYHCDRLGMLVWQDQPSGGVSPPWTRMKPDPVDADWTAVNHAQYMLELERMIDSLENHPSIVIWVPFNEAWGQHRTVEVGRWISRRDPSRLVNVASGGNFWPVGDVADHHAYPHPDFPLDQSRFNDYVKVVGEFGGHGFPVKGHLWDAGRRNWGYGGLPKTMQEYKDRYVESMRRLQELKAKGIAAGVYTQTTDVEGEINGLMSYDRKKIKIPAKKLRPIHAGLVE
ncbi:glycoside hydrolase family 2 protein [Novipirellula artificiosorum]|uniref:Beta-galactosidase n=1 Tax=Novipirellula artificiosorum TaxID=2528016 RepID=A0A5C6DYS1_9BACT|nr:sugar-binding domain-containing protein [Novipirellula artificiosorum]TWU40987.1 Beta-galactosidase [Novipirellula artificiosorum]